MNKNKHMVLDDRYEIYHGLNKQMSFKAIAHIIGKDCTTVSKEIKNHLMYEKKGAQGRPFCDCIHRNSCFHYNDRCSACKYTYRSLCARCGICTIHCDKYEKETCNKLLKAPFVCNGCSNQRLCTLEKRIYDPKFAQKEYEQTLCESRSGVNLTESELHHIDSLISPLLKNGQSLHHIMANNADRIPFCEKTAYHYVDLGLFEARNIDMPRKVRFRPRKNKSIPLKVDKSCRINRSYEDFQAFRKEHPSFPLVEIDSVEGIKGGAVLLTVYFVLPKLQLAFLREQNDSASVTEIFHQIYNTLGHDKYQQLFPLILGDNGTEFSNPKALEYISGSDTKISNVFYCDPSSAFQKGACEVNHEMIRRIIPKGIDIGLYTSAQINLMMDHINSYGRPELGDKSPYEMFEFYYGHETLDLLGINQVKPNEIMLTPELLKK